MKSNKSGIIGDVFGELGETVKQTAALAVKVPGDVVKGALGQQDKKELVNEKSVHGQTLSSSKSDPDLGPKQAQQRAQLARKKAADDAWKKKRYQEIQNELKKVQIERQQQRERGLDVYVTAKPGEAETLEEKQGEVEKQRKLAEEQKKKEKKLPPSVRAGMGTAERVKSISG